MGRIDEFREKVTRVQRYLEQAGADGVALSRTDHFAWATCGGQNHVNAAAETGVATLLLIGDKAIVLTNRIENARLLDEELYELPLEIDILPWQADTAAHAMREYTGGKKVLSDAGFAGLPPLGADFMQVLTPLLPDELMRYRAVGGYTGRALQEACKAVRPGMSEFEIAGLLAHRCLDAGVHPIVLLIAADDRIKRYRHPLPTRNKLKKTAMLVVCGRRHGLVASCTRMVSAGKPEQDTMDRFAACVLVDVAFNVNTMPGRRVGDIFRTSMDTYTASDFDGEWNLHHQGGPAGYRPRYYLANEDSGDIVAANTAYAWNPSITGVKSEDTLLVLEDHNELITQAPDWPQIEIEVENFSIQRPDILVV